MISIPKKTLESLEFQTVLEQIAAYSVTTLGKKQILKITPFQSPEEVLPELQRTSEFKASLHSDNPIPNHGYEAIDKELKLFSIENSTLEISGFRKIKTIVETTITISKFFKKYEEFYMQLHALSEKVEKTPFLLTYIQQVFDPYGQVKNNASVKLASIRQDLQQVKGKIGLSFTQALARYGAQDYLDEIRETIVDNRRVLAVKAMHRKKIKGAVLGSSKTGSIVYIEPKETLEYTNELSNLIYEEDLEIKRILKELTQKLRPYADSLKEQQEYLTHIDILAAKARYADDMQATLPIISNQRRLFLKNAYHPLLLYANKKSKKKTYPQTIELHPENRIIVISGPNAGGKSITLKTVGLLQLMLQSGMLIPVDSQSELFLFNKILTDIGDNQSIENHLSTYSYRLKTMNQFLKKCNEKTLFLIDEFGTGSDPELGGALAETFLEVFYERKSFGIITTHYTNLKLLASELPFATNANMQFNNKTLEPMYQLQLGEAGSSFTFEVAQKNGIPYSLINKAKKKIERGKVRFDKSIANLQKERFQLRKTKEDFQITSKRAAEQSKQLEEINIKIQEKLENYQELYDTNQRYISIGKKVTALAENYFYNKRKKTLLDELFKLVLVINSKLKLKKPTEKKKEIQKQKITEKEVIEKVKIIRAKKKTAKKIQDKKEKETPVIAPKIGDRVRMKGGRAIGTLEKIEKKKAKVNYGTFTSQVSLSDLEKVS